MVHLKYKDMKLNFAKVKQNAEELQLDAKGGIPAIESPVLTSLEDQILDAVESAP